jgi:hypothetical protein
MNRSILVCVSLFMATAVLSAQDANQSGPYQGTSTPPPDDTIVTTSAAQPKPQAGQPVASQQEQDQAATQAQPSAGAVAVNNADSAGGTVAVQPAAPAPEQPALIERGNAADPDGDIVHPRPLRPGELPEGVTIRVELLDRLSTLESEKGEAFRSRVASDVLQGGQVLIPAGAEIDGRVVEVSSGHPGGRGTMRLRPETVILSDGRRYKLFAQVTGTPGSRTKVGSEGAILPDSRIKHDSIEYGGAVGAGAASGAIVGGPAGALTGSIIGAGLVTVHLLVSHPQARLELGTTLLFTLTEPLQMEPAGASKN